MVQEWRAVAPAKVNMTLDLLGRDVQQGYHLVDMVMTSIDLKDYLTFRETTDYSVSLTSSVSYLPTNDTNHVLQAVSLLRHHCGIQTGVAIHIDKHIPVAAGLGGGSADAAAALRSLNEQWQLGLSQNELQALAFQVGTDVPFCVHQRLARVSGYGERITPLPDVLSFWVVVVKLPISVSTPKVFAALWAQEEAFAAPKTSEMIAAIAAQDVPRMMGALSNGLESVTFARYPQLGKLKEKMEQFGALGCVMTGSGPTLIGWCHTQRQAQRVAQAMSGYKAQIWVCKVL